MNGLKKFISILLMGGALVACTQTTSTTTPGQNPMQGGTEFGNPAPVNRMVIGTVYSYSQDHFSSQMMPECPADVVVATDSANQNVQATLKTDCSFSLSLATGKAYTIRFEKGGKFVARLVVNPGDTFPSFVFFLSDAPTPVDLGLVTFKDALAIPTNSPLAQNDRDGDGQADSVDTDDDNDGVADGEEKDCDLDGFLDDNDPSSACTPLGTFKPVLQVSPFNGQTGVGLVDRVKIRLGCPVDVALFAISDLVVKPSGAAGTIPCIITFSADKKTIECEHNGNPFLPNTSYDAILSAVECEGGAKAQAMTWSWTTGP